MGLSINTNIAATRSSMYLATNHANLQKSLDRLSSGKRITEPADDAGGLAVSMKLEHTGKVLRATSNNISNGISLLQVQDGILKSAGDIVSRMGELKAMHSDVTKNAADIANYDAEFNDLQGQLYQLSLTEFNGIRVFGDFMDPTDGSAATNEPTSHAVIFNSTGADDSATNSGLFLQVNTSEDGSAGPQVGAQRALLLSAITVTQTSDGATPPSYTFTVGANGFEETAHTDAGANGPITGTFSLATSDPTNAANIFSLGDVTQELFTTALQNVATLRASNGGQTRHLQFAQANVENQITNLSAANGRIMDVDIAQESSNLAKQQILVQASASMTAQANVANDVALMLLR